MTNILNYLPTCREIASTALACGRNPADIALIAVTKQVDPQTALKLYNQGQRNFGENRLPDAFLKQNEMPSDCLWHFIGNLQKNKVRKAIGKFTLIHSVDSPELADKISLTSQECGVVTSILLQANTSGEASKHGLSPDEWKKSYLELSKLKGITIQGLMTMAPLNVEEDAIHACFRELRLLRDELNEMAGNSQLFHLSMGMSEDFKIAIEEGATLLRIGSALFR
jgi:pyridoxal phosphate enzyme (YggS family)